MDGDNVNLELDEKFGSFDISLFEVNIIGFKFENFFNN